jgi:hypothetical protein
MTKKNENEKEIDLSYRIWEGSVGICIKPQKKKDGTYFWKYSLTRCYKEHGSDDWRYDSFFSRHNDEALATVLSKASQFMDQNDATEYACEKLTLAKDAKLKLAKAA